MFLATGANYVVPDFAWVQDVDGSLMVLADRSVAPLPGYTRMPRISVLTGTESISVANPPAGISLRLH
jgi:hypothetical protein